MIYKFLECETVTNRNVRLNDYTKQFTKYINNVYYVGYTAIKGSKIQECYVEHTADEDCVEINKLLLDPCLIKTNKLKEGFQVISYYEDCHLNIILEDNFAKKNYSKHGFIYTRKRDEYITHYFICSNDKELHQNIIDNCEDIKKIILEIDSKLNQNICSKNINDNPDILVEKSITSDSMYDILSNFFSTFNSTPSREEEILNLCFSKSQIKLTKINNEFLENNQ